MEPNDLQNVIRHAESNASESEEDAGTRPRLPEGETWAQSCRHWGTPGGGRGGSGSSGEETEEEEEEEDEVAKTRALC